MSWQSVTLKDSLKGISDKTQSLLNDFNSQLAEAQDLLSILDSKIANAEALLNQNIIAIDDLSNTGVKVIILTPSSGIWYNRLQSAQNAPSLSASLYTTIHASLFVAPSLDSIKAQFDAMLASFNEQLLPPSINIPDLSIPDLTPSLTDKFQLPFDFWSDTSIGAVFPGLINTLRKDNQELEKTLKDLKNTKQLVEANIQGLQSIISDLQKLLDDLQNSGVFTVTLSPAVGSWLDRLKNEPNAPAGLQYSAGLCVVGTAIDLAGVAKQYYAILRAF